MAYNELPWTSVDICNKICAWYQITTIRIIVCIQNNYEEIDRFPLGSTVNVDVPEIKTPGFLQTERWLQSSICHFLCFFFGQCLPICITGQIPSTILNQSGALLTDSPRWVDDENKGHRQSDLRNQERRSRHHGAFLFHRSMMTSSNGNIFRVTGHLCGEFTGHKGQWRGALMFSLICARINGWVNNRKDGDLRRHYDVIVMKK